ncbi:Conserved hypothetical protein [Shewanella piezotolerans WP3]|uniref:Uncharacterized protein n=1 Tax=Shewanella piezotolerans (strain WP3 / JCM 13877) TaxID=225849 RepID=B8CNV5_SHEPW|nr:hypothetical protein [Shewanella piezotolerans]ACJ29074.1 Conserved hypothetical protein [Shewanella piezotolerans WP3]
MPSFTAISANGQAQNDSKSKQRYSGIGQISASRDLAEADCHRLLAPIYGSNATDGVAKIPTPIKRINESKQPLNPASSKSYYPSIFLFLLVIAMHALVIAIINQSWTKQDLQLPDLAPVKISSYLYVAPKKVQLEPIDDEAISKKMTVDKVLVEKAAEINEKLEPDTPVESLPVVLDRQTAVNGSAEVTKESVIETSAKIASKSNRYNAIAAAQSYLQRQNDAALDALIIDKANEYTGPHSLSVMDGDMEELVFPEVDKYSKVPTNDHRLDPNRVVRQGDTCYRIVKTPTQINPYAENIGFPFNCGGDKVKEAINAAISARLEKRMISRKK